MSQLRSNVLVKERQHDYLYDPIYTLSGFRDHERAMQKSYHKLSRLEKLFNFENFFSEISAHRPFTWCINKRDPIPPNVSREFRPKDICGELLKMKLRAAGGSELESDVIGRDRAKYFNYRVGCDGIHPPNDMLLIDIAIESLGQKRLVPSEQCAPEESTFASKAVQTDYRDSEAQTDPYTPPYVVNVGETPEVLTLATMGYGRGLPAGLHDVEMIERARERRQIETKLEPYSQIAHDPKKVAQRRKILQDLELREWHYREREVEALQEVRLKVLVQLLRKREEHQQEAAARRLDRIWAERCAAKEERCKRIQHQFITALRKLMRRRLAMNEPSHKRDVIKDYSTPSSRAFAPLTRLGVFPDRGSEAYTVKNAYLNTYEGLLDLENSLPRFCLQAKIAIKPIRMYTRDGFLKRDFRNQHELAKLQQYFDGAFSPQQGPPRKPRFLEKIERPPPRPITPSIAPPNEETTVARELAAIKLQQLIRGRAIQTQMFEGKEKRKELIAEIRSTHALLEDEEAEKRRQKEQILRTKEERAELDHQDHQMDNILGQMESGSLADMLDFLSKELDRLIEERRIHALVLLAERHRRMREAEESGTRQREERRVREQDEIFKQLVKVHQESVDGYLASVAGIAIDSTADHIARHEMDAIAREVDARARDLEVNRDELQSDLIAADLVHNFLIPEVNKRAHQHLLNMRQRTFLLAAHREIWTPAHEAAELQPPPPPPPPSAAPLPPVLDTSRHDVSTMTLSCIDQTPSKHTHSNMDATGPGAHDQSGTQ